MLSTIGQQNASNALEIRSRKTAHKRNTPERTIVGMNSKSQVIGRIKFYFSFGWKEYSVDLNVILESPRSFHAKTLIALISTIKHYTKPLRGPVMVMLNTQQWSMNSLSHRSSMQLHSLKMNWGECIGVWGIYIKRNQGGYRASKFYMLTATLAAQV